MRERGKETKTINNSGFKFLRVLNQWLSWNRRVGGSGQG